MAAAAAIARAGEPEAHPSNLRLLTLAALGVVYGDRGDAAQHDAAATRLPRSPTHQDMPS
jgi:hypothetical protein